MRIPTVDIDDTALPRDRSALDAEALDELQRSIAASGLRQPIEVYQTLTGYALISGYRRLTAVRRLHAATGDSRWAMIQTVLRSPADRAEALAAMVEENEVRQNPSPWERAAIAVASVETGIFETLDAALAALFAHASRQKRAKLRSIAEVVETFEGRLTDPETLTERQLLRLSSVLRLGWVDLLRAALSETCGKPAADQWQTLGSVLSEAESLVASGRSTSPNRPKRLSHPRAGLVIRREKTRSGYLLHVTGPRAGDALVGEVLSEIERMFSGT